MFSVNYRLIPLDDEFNVPVEEFFTENDGIILATRMPDRQSSSASKHKKILEKNDDKVVIIDEAYV